MLQRDDVMEYLKKSKQDLSQFQAANNIAFIFNQYNMEVILKEVGKNKTKTRLTQDQSQGNVKLSKKVQNIKKIGFKISTKEKHLSLMS